MPLGCPPADKFKVMTLPLAGLMCRLGPDDPFLGTAVRWIRASSKLAQTEVGLSCGKSDGAELHHQEQPITGIRGPSADAIGMTPAKAERVCIDSPLEGAGFETSIPLTRYVGLFAERCGQKTPTEVASDRRTILAGPNVLIRLAPAASQRTIFPATGTPCPRPLQPAAVLSEARGVQHRLARTAATAALPQ